MKTHRDLIEATLAPSFSYTIGIFITMRILHVIGTLSPAYGGPSEAVRQLAKNWQRLGVHAEVACADPSSAPFLRNLSCPVHAFGPALLGPFALTPGLRPWLRANVSRFDAVIVHGIWTFPGLAVRAAARSARIPYGVFIHGGLDPWFNRAYPLKRIKKSIYWPLQYPVLRDAHAVFFTAELERDLAKSSFQPSQWNSVVVPYGTNEPVGDPSVQIETFYQQFPALRQRPFFLFLGRLHQKKGCDLLVEAFSRIAPSVPTVDLVIAGPDQQGLQAKLTAMTHQLGVTARVHWTGSLEGDLKWGALRAAQAFVLPSHQENFGIAVAESLAAGRPVLISDQVNIWKAIQDAGVGLVEPDTLDGTVQLLRRWFALTEMERVAMANRARPTFQRQFSIGATALALRKIFAPEPVANVFLKDRAS
jgi:glycosyltransferase involved in cell wall biosynthesis